MADEESANKKPQDVAKNEQEEEPQFNKKGALYAIIVIAVIFIVATILGQTVGRDDDEVSAEVPPADAPAPEEPSEAEPMMYFNRISNFLPCTQLDANCNVDDETVSEIVYASEDGNTLLYTDASLGTLGFVDITDAKAPQPLGTIDVGGEPTSVVVVGDYAVVCVNTSPSFTEPSGIFHIIDVATQEVLRTGDLGGQPDATAVSPDGNFVAVAIENERDEDLNDGLLPQFPAGFLVVMDTSSGNVQDWALTNIELTGLEGVLYPEDPEPEYVDINADNICAVTLQENNAIVLVDLEAGEVIDSFTAGATDLEGIDILENDKIEQTGSQQGRLREPDAVSWIGTEYFATADEGDLDGGSRTFTIYDKEGNVVYDSGTTMEDWVTRIGHYPEGRSENKGNEPETVRYAEFGSRKILFVNSERSSVIFVYDVGNVESPELLQILPAGVGPEGIVAIPGRNLVAVASEEDNRGNKIRAHVTLYELQDAAPAYPTIESATMDDGKYIPFSALSGLASSGSTLYSVEDSFYKSSRIFTIDSTLSPPTITDAKMIMDSNGVLAGAVSVEAAAILLNEDQTVNLDLEGIDVVDGGFWLCSEGRGTVGDVDRPVETPNLLVRVNGDAVIEEVVTLPEEVNGIQVRFGFEGVAVDGDNLVVAIQRAWGGEENPRLGIYNTANQSWKFVFYSLETPASQNGGWVGLSDLESLGDGQFLVLERDNQGGPDAAIKRIYSIDLGDYSLAENSVVSKTAVRDLLPDLLANGGLAMEKVEGLTIDGSGNVWVNNDNDGVDDNSGEHLLLNLGEIA